jgi:integrase
VADYIIELRERGNAGSTLTVAVSAISHRNKHANCPSPLDHPQVREVLAGAKRLAARAGAGRGPSEPLLPADIRSFVTKLKSGLVGQRDMALLTFGLAGGFRREELCRLTLDCLRFDGSGVLVTLRFSKTDQEGEGHTRRISLGDSLDLCPVANVRTWLAASGITSGYLFRPIVNGRAMERPLSPRRVDQIVREYTRRVMAETPGALAGKRYSAHSLRAGLCTAAALAGKSEREIREHVDHKSAQTTARYIRGAKIRASAVTKGIGL